MKKTLLSVFAFLFCVSFVQAQCTPDPVAVAMGLPGLYPNPVTDSLANGYVGVAYNQTITIIVPADTTIVLPFPLGPQTVQIIKQSITSIDSLPTGVTHTCNVNGCTWTGGSNGCVKLAGTPTVAGVYNVKINLTTQASYMGNPVAIPGYTVPYTITISNAQGIENQLDANYFRFAPCVPNPAVENTTLSFSSPSAANISATVYDLAGRLVKTESFRCESGINAYNLNVKGLNSGIYIVALTNGEMTLKQKLAVK